MKAQKPVWTDGLFMTQHHLQVQDRYHEALLGDRLEAAVRFAWGVREVEVDAARLKNNQVVVTKLSAIFSDGTPISWSRNHGEPPAPRDIGVAFPAHIRSLAVHVGIAYVSETSGNIDLDGETNGARRFLGRTVSVPDYNAGGAEHDVQVARPYVHVLLGEENHQGFERIQVAELVRTQSGEIVLRDTFVPPILRLSASPFVASGFRRVLETMTSRQRDLAESRRQRGNAQVEFQASDVTRLWLLQTLNESIPTFSYLSDSEQSVSAEAGYLALATLIGKLCTFSADMDPTSIPSFRYLALGDCFEPMFAQAVSLIRTVIQENYIEIPLHRQANDVLVGTVEMPQVLDFEFFLAVVGRVPDGDVRERLPNLSKVASLRQITQILNSAVRGLRLDVEFEPPGALPVKPGMVFFRIRKTVDYWDDVRTTAKLALYHPFPKESLALSLYAVDPKDL